MATAEPLPPGLIMPPVPETEVAPLAQQIEAGKESGGVAEQGGAAPGGGDPARPSSATEGNGTAEMSRMTAKGSFLLKLRMRKHAARARISVRHEQREQRRRDEHGRERGQLQRQHVQGERVELQHTQHMQQSQLQARIFDFHLQHA